MLEGICLWVIAGEFAGEHDVVRMLTDGIDQVDIAHRIFTLSFKQEVDDQHPWLAGFYLLDDLGNVAAVAQFGHVDQHDGRINLYTAVPLYFVINIGHGEIVEGAFHGAEDRQVEGGYSQNSHKNKKHKKMAHVVPAEDVLPNREAPTSCEYTVKIISLFLYCCHAPNVIVFIFPMLM